MTHNKKCKKCGETKPVQTEFYLAGTRKGRAYWSSRCRKCLSQGSAAYQTGRRSKLRETLWRYLLEHPCVDCKERDPRVLQFDHRDRSLKIMSISNFASRGYAWKRIAAEIAKTDVRCANCHSRRTAEQLGWYASIPPELKELAA